MSNIIDLTVIDVTRENLIELWPSIIFALKSSTFVAVDLELSGLGDRKLLNTSCLEDRYKALCSIAHSRSVISLGIACFKELDAEGSNEKRIYKVQVFNVLLLCDGEYAVESQSLKFLVAHGFNFNKQYSHGISYTKGNCFDAKATPSIRQLVIEIIMAQKPLVVHNGLIDLVFFYQCFYAELPSTLQTFVADLCEMFPAGIFDTKYISEFHARENLSVLEYLFRKCQYQNHAAQVNKQQFMEIASAISPDHTNNNDHEIVHCILPTMEISNSFGKYIPMLCKTFESRGFCPLELSCPKIHSIELIIANENIADEKKKKRKRKRKRKSSSANESLSESFTDPDEPKAKISCPTITQQEQVDIDKDVNGSASQQLTKETFDSILLPRLNGHRAGFDAFMTGYCLAFYKMSQIQTAQEWSNKVYLTARDVPLNILKSHFAKTSHQHQKMMIIIAAT